MAFRSPNYLRRMTTSASTGIGTAVATYATSTAPRMKAYAPTTVLGKVGRRIGVKGEFVPVYVALGMILMSMTLGLHAAKQHLAYDPTVRVRKGKREVLPELIEPEKVVEESDKFRKRSLFRKVAHVQELDLPVPEPIRVDVLAPPPKAETLKTIGVDPKQTEPAVRGTQSPR